MTGRQVITREWSPGVELPMTVQRVKGDAQIEATRGKVALRYGPLVYTVERADQLRTDLPLGRAAVVPEWRGELLGGVTVFRGRWQGGTPMTAAPYYARANRTGVPVREFPRGEGAVEYAPAPPKAAEPMPRPNRPRLRGKDRKMRGSG